MEEQIKKLQEELELVKKKRDKLILEIMEEDNIKYNKIFIKAKLQDLRLDKYQKMLDRRIK